jgi:hypothetical protein
VLDNVRAILKRHTIKPHTLNLNEIVEDVGIIVHITLAHTGRTQHEDVFVVGHPGRFLGQCTDHAPVQSSLGTIIDVLNAGRSP